MKRMLQWAIIGLVVVSIYCPWALLVFERRHPWCPVTAENWTQTVPAALTWQRVEPEDVAIDWIRWAIALHRFLHGDGSEEPGGGGAGGGGGGAG